MSISYLKFMKHAGKVAASASKARPILSGVLHRNKSLAVTDSHRLYYATGIAPEGEDFVINPKTGDEVSGGNYPDVERLIPIKGDAKACFRINVDFATKVAKLIENAEKISGGSRVKISAVGDEIFLTTGGESVSVSAPIGKRADASDDDFILYADAKYVSEAFAMLKDSRENSVEFRFYGELRPFTVTAGDGLLALILPLRIA